LKKEKVKGPGDQVVGQNQVPQLSHYRKFSRMNNLAEKMIEDGKNGQHLHSEILMKFQMNTWQASMAQNWVLIGKLPEQMEVSLFD